MKPLNYIQSDLFSNLYYYEPAERANEQLPAFFYFSLSAKNSLSLAPFNEPVRLLGGRPVRIYSLSLPFHDEILTPTESMMKWVEQINLKQDPLKDFLIEMRKILDHLFEKNLIDPTRCAVGGLSRGAYASVRLAAADRRFTHILGYAPLIDHAVLDEEGQESAVYSALELVDKLVGRPLKFLVGNHDTRINTDTCYGFIRQLTLASISQGIRSPEVELSIKPSIGFRGHGTSPETFEEGINWLLKKFGVL